jgi:hypothetical protein
VPVSAGPDCLSVHPPSHIKKGRKVTSWNFRFSYFNCNGVLTSLRHDKSVEGGLPSSQATQYACLKGLGLGSRPVFVALNSNLHEEHTCVHTQTQTRDTLTKDMQIQTCT